MSKVEETLEVRGSDYGTFENNARCTQKMLNILEDSAALSGRVLKDYELEAAHMVLHKLSRIVCGMPKKDNWHDIAGYAKLAEDLTTDGKV